MPFKAYEEFAQEPLAFPINGKTYTVPPLSIENGLRINSIMRGTDKSMEDAPQEELFKLVMGGVWEQMLSDGVPFEAAFRAGLASVADVLDGRTAAEATWESGIDPEALAAWMAAKQGAANPPASPRSNSSASARKTRSRASTTPTTSRKGTPRGSAKQ